MDLDSQDLFSNYLRFFGIQVSMKIQTSNTGFIKDVAALSLDVYNDHSDGPVQGWFRLQDTNGETQSGYFGAVYVDSLTEATQAVIAHRGTNNLKDLIDDLDIWKGKVFPQMKDAGKFCDEVCHLLYKTFSKIVIGSDGIHRNEDIDDFESRFYKCHTGHSLGAILAEMSGMGDQVFTFENPGTKPILIDFIDTNISDPEKRNYVLEYILGFTKQNNMAIQSHVNMVNTCNEQIGNVYRCWNKPYKYNTATSTSILDPFVIPTTYLKSLYYVDTYTFQQHKMKDIVEYIVSDGELRPDVSPIGFNAGYQDYLDTSRHIGFWIKHFNDLYDSECPIAKLYDRDTFIAKGIDSVNETRKNAFMKSTRPTINIAKSIGKPHVSIPPIKHDPRIFGGSIHDDEWVQVSDSFDMPVQKFFLRRNCSVM